MLTILNDPAGITGRKSYAWDYSKTLHENIASHLTGGADCEVRINGVQIDPLTDARMHLPPSMMDMVTVSRRPEGFDPFTWLLIAVAASVVVTYALMPRIDTGAGNAGKDSPNNRLTAQSNTARAYQGIPDVYGSRRVWPDMIQPSTVEYIDHIKYVTEWLCVSRGAGDITAVQYADTPIEDIEGASFEVFEPVGSGYPEYNPTTLTDVIETFSSPEVNGQEIVPPTQYPDVTGSGATFVCVTGESTFTLAIPDGSNLDHLKSLAPTGIITATVLYDAGSDTGILTPFYGTTTVLGFTVSGGVCTFEFSSSSWEYDLTTSVATYTLSRANVDPITIGPYTLPLDCDRLRWNTVFLRGLKGSVTINAEWWKIDGSGIEISGTRQTQNNTYAADTYDQRFYTTDVTPSSGNGRYRIQFTRVTPTLGDGSASVAKLENLFAVRYYAEKVLPGVTVIRVTTIATEQATSISDRKFNLRFSRHIRTLTSDTLSASRNFARIMAHIWTLAGNDIAELDTTSLAAINTEFGETSELLRFDGSLDDADTSLGERLQLVANHARCIVWRDGQKWTVTRDQARQYPELQLDYRNLAAGGESAISYAAHLPASNDGVEIEYVDPTTQAKKSYVRLSIASGAPVTGESTNPKKIKLLGCTNTAQAANRAQLEARRLLYQRISVSDKALSDANGLGLGSLVRWIDPNDFFGDDGLQAGEVLSISGSTIRTSEPLHWGSATSGRISFTGVDGARLGPPVVCTPTDGGAILASVPSGLFVASSTRQLGSRYAFAVGLTEAEVESAGLYTVTEIKPDGDGSVSLSLAQYDSRIYGAD